MAKLIQERDQLRNQLYVLENESTVRREQGKVLTKRLAQKMASVRTRYTIAERNLALAKEQARKIQSISKIGW